jgi:hypothetical protein
MTLVTEWRYGSAIYDHRYDSWNARPQRIFGGAALACVALSCLWTLGVNLSGSTDGSVGGDQVEVAGTRGDKLFSMRPSAPALSNAFASLFDPRASLGFSPGTFARPAAPQADDRQAATPVPSSATPKAQGVAATPLSGNQSGNHVAQSAPPQHRPQQVRTTLLAEAAHANAAAAKSSAAAPTIFEKLFGKPSPLTLAYAAPDDGGLVSGPSPAAGRYDRWTAVYDISAHTVYMPDGTRLEAHSGLGNKLDDPRYVAAKDVGVTPPDVYDLEPREALFHGVRALRLVPEDESKVYGRSGFLTHSFMLGPNGDSNGCVSFRNYEAFLEAYDHQQVKRLVVVTRLE